MCARVFVVGDPRLHLHEHLGQQVKCARVPWACRTLRKPAKVRLDGAGRRVLAGAGRNGLVRQRGRPVGSKLPDSHCPNLGVLLQGERPLGFQNLHRRRRDALPVVRAGKIVDPVVARMRGVPEQLQKAPSFALSAPLHPQGHLVRACNVPGIIVVFVPPAVPDQVITTGCEARTVIARVDQRRVRHKSAAEIPHPQRHAIGKVARDRNDLVFTRIAKRIKLLVAGADFLQVEDDVRVVLEFLHDRLDDRGRYDRVGVHEDDDVSARMKESQIVHPVLAEDLPLGTGHDDPGVDRTG